MTSSVTKILEYKGAWEPDPWGTILVVGAHPPIRRNFKHKRDALHWLSLNNQTMLKGKPMMTQTAWGELDLWVLQQGGWPTYCRAENCQFIVLQGYVYCRCSGTLFALPEPFQYGLRQKLFELSRKYGLHPQKILNQYSSVRRLPRENCQHCGNSNILCCAPSNCNVQTGNCQQSASKTLAPRRTNPSFMNRVTGLFGWSNEASNVRRIQANRTRPIALQKTLTVPLRDRTLL